MSIPATRFTFSLLEWLSRARGSFLTLCFRCEEYCIMRSIGLLGFRMIVGKLFASSHLNQVFMKHYILS